jgi:hypothetical protein
MLAIGFEMGPRKSTGDVDNIPQKMIGGLTANAYVQETGVPAAQSTDDRFERSPIHEGLGRIKPVALRI